MWKVGLSNSLFSSSQFKEDSPMQSRGHQTTQNKAPPQMTFSRITPFNDDKIKPDILARSRQKSTVRGLSRTLSQKKDPEKPKIVTYSRKNSGLDPTQNKTDTRVCETLKESFCWLQMQPVCNMDVQPQREPQAEPGLQLRSAVRIRVRKSQSVAVQTDWSEQPVEGLVQGLNAITTQLKGSYSPDPVSNSRQKQQIKGLEQTVHKLQNVISSFQIKISELHISINNFRKEALREFNNQKTLMATSITQFNVYRLGITNDDEGSSQTSINCKLKSQSKGKSPNSLSPQVLLRSLITKISQVRQNLDSKANKNTSPSVETTKGNGQANLAIGVGNLMAKRKKH